MLVKLTLNDLVIVCARSSGLASDEIATRTSLASHAGAASLMRRKL